MFEAYLKARLSVCGEVGQLNVLCVDAAQLMPVAEAVLSWIGLSAECQGPPAGFRKEEVEMEKERGKEHTDLGGRLHGRGG